MQFLWEGNLYRARFYSRVMMKVKNMGFTWGWLSATSQEVHLKSSLCLPRSLRASPHQLCPQVPAGFLQGQERSPWALPWTQLLYHLLSLSPAHVGQHSSSLKTMRGSSRQGTWGNLNPRRWTWQESSSSLCEGTDGGGGVTCSVGRRNLNESWQGNCKGTTRNLGDQRETVWRIKGTEKEQILARSWLRGLLLGGRESSS